MDGREYTRNKVRLRDNNTCQKCAKKWTKGTRRFDVHHLNGVCGKKSRAYDKVSEMYGLITYCHKCHIGLHEVRNKIEKASHERLGLRGTLYEYRTLVINKMHKEYIPLKVIGKIFGVSSERIRQIVSIEKGDNSLGDTTHHTA